VSAVVAAVDRRADVAAGGVRYDAFVAALRAVFTGPRRAAWRRPDAVALWPAVLSLGFLLSVLSLFVAPAAIPGRSGG